MAKIIYTKVDEAPQLAAASLLPIIERFLSEAGLDVETRDISLAGRIIAAWLETFSSARSWRPQARPARTVIAWLRPRCIMKVRLAI